MRDLSAILEGLFGSDVVGLDAEKTLIEGFAQLLEDISKNNICKDKFLIEQFKSTIEPWWERIQEEKVAKILKKTHVGVQWFPKVKELQIIHFYKPGAFKLVSFFASSNTEIRTKVGDLDYGKYNLDPRTLFKDGFVFVPKEYLEPFIK